MTNMLDPWLMVGLALASIGACLYLIRRQRNRIDVLQKDLAEQQKAMQKALAAAEAASAAKSDFLANTSHEIRTPMNAILGMTRLLLDSPLTPEQQSWAEIVRDSGSNLLGIINDILDLSKIEAGCLVLTPEAFDLYHAIAEVTDLLIHQAEQKKIALLVDIAPHAPRYVMGDALRLKQIILNLVSNAKKFTSEGYVKLTLVCATSDGGEPRLVFRVMDTGIGIAEDKLPHIFDKFTQAEESTTRQFGGTGLGLAITKKLVTMMSGTINVQSKVGQGSCFVFSIPFLETSAPPNAIPDISLRGKNMLILADIPQASDILKRYAENCGLQVKSCATAVEVLDCLQAAHQQAAPFDYLLIEHGMGGVRILELIERIRIFPEFQKLEILTAATLGSATATRLLNSNKVSGLLTRPIFPNHLHDMLCVITSRQQAGTPASLVTRNSIEKLRVGTNSHMTIKAAYQGAHILVVEDIEVNQILMKKILEKLGCHSDAAMSGMDALGKLLHNSYDLIFMDGHMPGMDGFEATQRIRQSELENGQHSIIIALTADAMSGDAEKYINAGMDDYMNKPVTPERIAKTLEKWLARS